MKVGVNLFGAEKWLCGEFREDGKRLKATGFSSVEADVVFTSTVEGMEEKLQAAVAYMGNFLTRMWMEEAAKENIKIARECGLNVISVHIMLCQIFDDALERMLPAIIRFGKELDIKYFVVSYSQATTAEMDKYIPYMKQASETLKKEGMTLVYHNHETECAVDNGEMVLDYILEQCPDLMLEIDTGWVQFAGQSPVGFVKKYKDRLVLLHLKDIAADASLETRDSCFTAVGEGCVPFTEILKAVAEYGLDEDAVIIDQDDSAGDMFEDYAAGIKYLETIG